MSDINMIPLPDGAGKKIHKQLYKTIPKALTFASGDTEKSFTIDVTATMKRAILKMPIFSGAVVTGALSIEDSDGVPIYEKTGMGENDTHVRLTDESLVGENTVKVTLSEDPVSDGICHVSFYLEGN